MLKIQRFEFNPFQVNTYVVYDPQTKETLIVDPGMFFPEESDRINDFISGNGLKVIRIINTHLHLDHIFGNQTAAERFKVTPCAHPADFPLGKSLIQQTRNFGIPESYVRQPEEFLPINDGDNFKIGLDEIKVIAVPGHSPGGIALYCPAEHWVITGDSLFQASIGRTDLPGGNHFQLIEAVRTRLLTLPPETVVYPGHGPSTTIAAEMHNPYL